MVLVTLGNLKLAGPLKSVSAVDLVYHVKFTPGYCIRELEFPITLGGTKQMFRSSAKKIII